jgi:hypothetical protein
MQQTAQQPEAQQDCYTIGKGQWQPLECEIRSTTTSPAGVANAKLRSEPIAKRTEPHDRYAGVPGLVRSGPIASGERVAKALHPFTPVVALVNRKKIGKANQPRHKRDPGEQTNPEPGEADGSGLND